MHAVTLDPVILGIDSSLGTAVALIEEDGVVLADEYSEDPLGHAEVVGTLLRAALSDAAHGPVGGGGATKPVTVDAVAVGMGPGPFTGLRVGIAAGRTFAQARSLPVIAVPSHDAAAAQLLLADPFADVGRFAVVTDARRREFAFTVYDGVDDDGLPARVTEPALVPRDDIDDVLAALGAARHDVVRISAAMVALVGARARAVGRTLTGSEPLYLRAPDVTMPKRVAP